LSIFGSSLFVAGFTAGFYIFYNDFYNKPQINPEWNLTKSGSEIIIKNDGRIAASHLILTLQTPQDMTKNSPYIFHTVNVTKIEKINSRLLQIGAGGMSGTTNACTATSTPGSTQTQVTCVLD
jgi:phage gp45-like